MPVGGHQDLGLRRNGKQLSNRHGVCFWRDKNVLELEGGGEEGNCKERVYGLNVTVLLFTANRLT
jgi:hypothetical protein